MPAYRYTAIDLKGKKAKGVLQADSQRHARQIIRERGLTPFTIDAASEEHQHKAARSLFQGKSLSTFELSVVTRQLGTMVYAGLPIDEALAASAEHTDKRKSRELLLSLRSKVMEGESLAKAMGNYPAAFPNLFRATICAGESTGKLGTILNRLADHTEASADFQKRVGMAMIYPALLLLISVLIVTGLMTYVVPDVITVFVDSGQTLPTLTRGLMSVSNVMSQHGVWIILALCIFVIGLAQALRLPLLRMGLDKFILQFPLSRKFARSYNAVPYASTLHILISSGVPLVEAMEIAAKVTPNQFLQQRLAGACEQVKEGSALNIALKKVGYIPPIFIHMVASGETSGELEHMIEKATQSQEKELQAWISTMLALFEPATLLLMGGVVMVIVIAILLPILNMNQLVI